MTLQFSTRSLSTSLPTLNEPPDVDALLAPLLFSAVFSLLPLRLLPYLDPVRLALAVTSKITVCLIALAI